MAEKVEIIAKEKEGGNKKLVEKKEKDDGVITAVYKANLHCLQCARDIKSPLLRAQGKYIKCIPFIMCLGICFSPHLS